MIFNITDKFRLSQNFLKNYDGKQPKWGPIGYITYLRSYSRIKPDGKNEEFWETCKRVVEGCYTVQMNYCKNLRLNWNAHKAQISAQEMYSRMFDFKFLPGGRGLYSMGTDLIYTRGGIYLYNCAMVSTKDIHYDFSDPFVWMMDLEMCGVGVGFDTAGAGEANIKQPKEGDYTFVVEDSREGWCEALRVVLDAYVGKAKYPKEIDYSKIRAEGEPIVTSGGVAPGSGPLVKCIEEINSVLSKVIGTSVTSTVIVDIMNIIGKAVVSGGKRRSAQIAFGSVNDKEYMELKDLTKHKDEVYNWRWASNNSVLATEGMDYSSVIEQFSKSGEPGLIYLDKLKNYGRLKDPIRKDDLEIIGTNPCGEIGLPDRGLCNLVETFPSNHETYEDFERTLKYAYLYCKTVTLIPTHCERTNQVIMRQRRLGISQSGITQAMEKHGIREYLNWCDKGYTYLQGVDEIYSNWLCVTKSIKLTTVKPSGTISLLPGVTPGIHFPHSEYYIRRIRVQNTNQKLIKALRKIGYKNEDTKYNDNAVVFEFPVRSENFFRSKIDVSLWQQMELGSKMQHFWCDNSVSQTITFNESERELLREALELYEDRLKTTSFLPLEEGLYEQAPYETITEKEYKSLIKKLDTSGLYDINNGIHEEEEKFCDGDKCEVLI